MIASPSPKMCPHIKIILIICVIYLAKGEILSPGHFFVSFRENNLFGTKMSNFQIICVPALCLQAKANIVSNKEVKGPFEQCQLVSTGILSVFFLSSERLIKFMQMTLSPLETCKCSLCIVLWDDSSAESEIPCPGSTRSGGLIFLF